MIRHIEGEQRLGGDLVVNLDGDEVRRLAGLLQMAGEVARHPESDELALCCDSHLSTSSLVAPGKFTTMTPGNYR